MIDDRDEHRNRAGQRPRHEGDLEGQNVRSRDEGMRVRGGGHEREDTSRYGRSDDDRRGRDDAQRFEGRQIPSSFRGDDDRGYSWHQDRDPARFDEGDRGRSWEQAGGRGRDDQGRGMYGQDDSRGRHPQDQGRGHQGGQDQRRYQYSDEGQYGQDQHGLGRRGRVDQGQGHGHGQYDQPGRSHDQAYVRNQYGNQDYGGGQSGYQSGRDDDRDRGRVGGASDRSYQEPRSLAGTSGHLGHDPERDYGRGGPRGGGQGTGYGGREREAQHGPVMGAGQQIYDSERGQRGGQPMAGGQGGMQGQRGQSSAQPGAGGQQRSGAQGRRGPMNYQRSDQRIYEDVCDCLSDDHALDVSEVEVKVEKGEVTLTGTVESREMKRRLEDAIDHVPGVRDVNNHVKVKRQGESQQQGVQGSSASGTSSSPGSESSNRSSSPSGHARS